MTAPIVTIVMANHNGARHIEDALASALAQTMRQIEVIVADDGSVDDSLDRVRRMQATDGRVRVIAWTCNSGAAAARNRALAEARGRWIAIMDSDDLMHPCRLARLVAAAEQDGADIVADDAMAFDDAGRSPPHGLLPRSWAEGPPRWIDAAAYARANHLYAAGPPLGYLKPLIRSALLSGPAAPRYNQAMSIAEDYDLIQRLLLRGARMQVTPDLTYFYRRHAASLSHRLSLAALDGMLAADRAIAATFTLTAPVEAALAARRSSIRTAIGYETLVQHLKARRWARAFGAAAAQPRSAALLHLVLRERIRRGFARSPAPAAAGQHACIISRQRISGATRGSTAYLLGLRDAPRARGCKVHLLQPSPRTMGRVPVLRLGAEMGGFETIRHRGTVRIGASLIALDPRVWAWAAAGTLDRIARGAGIAAGLGAWGARAPYAVALPWTRDDLLFVARHAPACGGVLLADYAFTTAALPYALRPRSRSAVIMHDRFSSRPEQFRALGTADSVAELDAARETELLGGAEIVVAIQAHEARWVSERLPGRRVVLAPMAVVPAHRPQPGQDDVLLFVGSDTVPNIEGLRWFAGQVWPLVRAGAPLAILHVAGSAGGAAGPLPGGIVVHGVVADLGPLYAAAAVVVSPLRAGSGLKIKLIEALGHGKAVVATPITLQGVEDLADGVVVAADAPAFASEVLRLLSDRALRQTRGALALAAAHRSFSPAACYADFCAALAPSAADQGG